MLEKREKQLAYAVKKVNIEYLCCQAEHTPFPDNSFDLVTVAQAYHWFDFDLFRNEVIRVGKPNAILAVWSYGHVRIEPLIDDLLRNFHDHVVGPYWDNRRKYVTDGLRTAPFNFTEIPSAPFNMKLQWTLTELAGYLESWSAVQHCIRQTGNNPVPDCIEEISSHWNTNEPKNVNFPLTLRMGKIIK